MGGTSLAQPRRAASRLFTERVMVGRAIDIGCGPDPITDVGFPLLRDVRQWDLVDGDATLMQGVENESFDLVYSSHCLEHIANPFTAVFRWWELVTPGGYLVIVVPDEETYERFEWPPRRNGDHKHSYSTLPVGAVSRMPRSISVYELTSRCIGGRVISLLRLEDGFDHNDPRDQTALGSCECGIELVVRKEAP